VGIGQPLVSGFASPRIPLLSLSAVPTASFMQNGQSASSAPAKRWRIVSGSAAFGLEGRARYRPGAGNTGPLIGTFGSGGLTPGGRKFGVGGGTTGRPLE
jgi:hypothetical protein